MRGDVSCMCDEVLCIEHLEGRILKYFHGVSDAGSRLLFKFRSGTHGLNVDVGKGK